MAYQKSEKEKEDIQKTWMDRISYAKKCHKEWRKEFKVQESREYYYGKQLPPGENPNEFIVINKIYSHLQTQLPNLYSLDPYYYVKVKKTFNPGQLEAYENRGRLRQAALNYYKGELKLKEKARLGILDAEFAYGVIKVRHAFDEEPHPKAGKPIVGESNSIMTDEQGNNLVYPDLIPTNERFEITRVHPDDLVWGDNSGPLEYSWPFLGERIRMTREQAKNDKRLNQRIIENIKGYKEEGENDEEKPKSFWTKLKDTAGKKENDDNDLLIFWEIYDLHNKKYLMICEGATEPVMKPTDLPKGVEAHPYAILRFSLTDDGPYPLPPVSQSIDPQKEYNLARSGILKHRKRFNRKYEVVENMLVDEGELTKLETGDDGTIIRVQATGGINPIQDAQIDQTRYSELSLLNNDIVEMFGTPNQARGISEADSATEASIMENHLQVREGDKLSAVTDWLVEIGRKLDMLIQANFTKEMMVKVAGPRGEEWFTLTEDAYQEIEGEYDYSVNVGATRPRLPDIERSQWIAFLSQVVIPFPHILTAPSVMKRMAEMFHIEDEAALEELRDLGLKMMQGQLPMPGGGGSQAGVPEDNPIAKVLGAALGPQGGNTNGGGSPQSASVQ